MKRQTIYTRTTDAAIRQIVAALDAIATDPGIAAADRLAIFSEIRADLETKVMGLSRPDIPRPPSGAAMMRACVEPDDLQKR